MIRRNLRLKYVQRWDILYTSTSKTSGFIAVHPVIGRPHLFAAIRAPDSSRSLLHRRSLLPLSFSALQSRITFRPPLPLSSLSPSPRDAHYRNVSVTAVKNVNSRCRRHCPVDTKCPLAGIPIVDFGREGDVATHAHRYGARARSP